VIHRIPIKKNAGGCLQHGADVETIRRALCRDSRGRASGPLGAALDMLGARQ
jgi:hypothetical protein